LTDEQNARRFAASILCSAIILSIAVLCMGLNPQSCGYFDGYGTYWTSSSSPDTIRIRTLANSITTSTCSGKILSEHTSDVSGWAKVKGDAVYDINCEVSKEYSDDTSEVWVDCVLVRDSNTEIGWNQNVYDNDANQNDVTLSTGWRDFPAGTHYFWVYLRGTAVAIGTHSGSYSDTDFYEDGLKLEAETFYVYLQA